jgi:signal transduction histidine kinase
MKDLNEELRLTTHELSLLLDLSNLLAVPMSLPDQLHRVLEKIVQSLKFPELGMILLLERGSSDILQVRAAVGFSKDSRGAEEQRSRGAGEISPLHPSTPAPLHRTARNLGEQCVAKAIVVCRHLDGRILEFSLAEALAKEECRRYISPVTMISLPLTVRQQVIGSIVLGRAILKEENALSSHEFKLMMGIVQQLGLSIENAQLYQEAQDREAMLAELLHQVVEAQEAERQRIARELHDATGQSLTAIALGLRGVEKILGKDPGVVEDARQDEDARIDACVPGRVQDVATEHIKELKSFSTEALGELRRIIADLRPSQLDDLGLVAALQWYIQEFEDRYAIPTKFVVVEALTGRQGEKAAGEQGSKGAREQGSGGDLFFSPLSPRTPAPLHTRREMPGRVQGVVGSRSRLSPREAYETVLFRITQEALTNVARHAQASCAKVTLGIYSSHVELIIRDNGRGFEVEHGVAKDKSTGWGLLGIRERTLLLGDDYQIDSTPGEGTCIRVTVPLITVEDARQGEASDGED